MSEEEKKKLDKKVDAKLRKLYAKEIIILKDMVKTIESARTEYQVLRQGVKRAIKQRLSTVEQDSKFK